MRETSSVTTRTVLGYVEQLGGKAAVHAVLDAADLPETAEQLNDPALWVSYASRIRLFEAAAAHFGDPMVMHEAGRFSMRQGVAPSVVLAMRSTGSPAEVYRWLPHTIAKYSTTSTMELLDCDRSSATLRFTLHDGYEHSRLDCLYARGLISAIPEAFDLPPAQIVHDECESDGADACIFHVTWASLEAGETAAGTTALTMENAALRRQLDELRSATADLVSGDDLADVLQRVVERAAATVIARGYLLVVRGDEGHPLVHAHGLGATEVEQITSTLLAGRPVGPHSIVVDVASTRRQHGWLAAIGSEPIRGDREALGGYARHAAAALDMVSALATSRRAARRAEALLELAHRLARADGAQEVADVVADTLTAAVGCSSASVTLWDEGAQVLRPVASAGKSAAAAQVLRGVAVAPDAVPELAELLLHPSAIIVRLEDASPPLAALLRATEVEHMLVAPMMAAGRFQGVLTGSWQVLPATAGTESDLMQRLRGVGDQAAMALHNAQLKEHVRHQAEHDELTGLPNRRLFLRRLHDVLSSPTPGCTGVLFCDLDGFKQINDGFGHAAGDELLRQTAGRISASVRADDEVGRLSGDEFAMLLPHLADADEAQQVAQRLVDRLRQPFLVDGVPLRVSASIGLSLQHGPGGDADQLLRQADQAMYVAKHSGRDRIACVPAPRTADTGLVRS